MTKTLSPKLQASLQRLNDPEGDFAHAHYRKCFGQYVLDALVSGAELSRSALLEWVSANAKSDKDREFLLAKIARSSAHNASQSDSE